MFHLRRTPIFLLLCIRGSNFTKNIHMVVKANHAELIEQSIGTNLAGLIKFISVKLSKNLSLRYNRVSFRACLPERPGANPGSTNG